jgi:hypothetical protein
MISFPTLGIAYSVSFTSTPTTSAGTEVPTDDWVTNAQIFLKRVNAIDSNEIKKRNFGEVFQAYADALVEQQMELLRANAGNITGPVSETYRRNNATMALLLNKIDAHIPTILSDEEKLAALNKSVLFMIEAIKKFESDISFSENLFTNAVRAHIDITHNTVAKALLTYSNKGIR